jgi:hypothetical protein
MERAVLVRRVRDAYLLAAIAVTNLVANATPTDPFDTAVGDIEVRVESYGGALVGLAAVGVIFMVGMKYVKKIRGAA